MLHQRQGSGRRGEALIFPAAALEALADIPGIEQLGEECEETFQPVCFAEDPEQLAVGGQGLSQGFQLLFIAVEDAVAQGLRRYAMQCPVDMLLEALDTFPGVPGRGQGGPLVVADLDHHVEKLEVPKLFEEIQVPAVVLQVGGDQVVLIGPEVDLHGDRDGGCGQRQVDSDGQPGVKHDQRSQGFQQVIQHEQLPSEGVAGTRRGRRRRSRDFTLFREVFLRSAPERHQEESPARSFLPPRWFRGEIIGFLSARKLQ